MKIEDIPINLKECFQYISGKWYVVIPEIKYISDGYVFLYDAIIHLIDLDKEFTQSKEVIELKMRINQIKPL